MGSAGVVGSAGTACAGLLFAFFGAVGAGAAFFRLGFFAAGFWAGTFFFAFAAGLAGIGIFMPGMSMCCAATGIGTAASASALTVKVRKIFTRNSPFQAGAAAAAPAIMFV
jgi:hypothetical protein